MTSMVQMIVQCCNEKQEKVLPQLMLGRCSSRKVLGRSLSLCWLKCPESFLSHYVLLEVINNSK